MSPVPRSRAQRRADTLDIAAHGGRLLEARADEMGNAHLVPFAGEPLD